MYQRPPGGIVAAWWVALELDRLLKKIARQDSAAFEQLYPVLKPNLSRFLLWQFNNLDESDVEALVQQTLLRVWEKANTYHGCSPSSAKNWIISIARNLALDQLKQHKRQVSLELLLEGGLPEHHFEESTSSSNPLEEIIVQNEKLYQRIKHLTAREKQVLDLLKEGYTQKRVACTLNIAPPRVNQLIRAIRQKLHSTDA